MNKFNLPMLHTKKQFVLVGLFFSTILILILFASLGISLLRRSQLFRQYYPRCKNCNVIFISVDTLRGDELQCFGYTRDTAPNLCNFAQNSNKYTQAFSEASWTLPSHMSMFTSQYPSTHKVRVSVKDVLSPQITTLSQIMNQNGYLTIFVGELNKDHMPIRKGIGRGFEELEEYVNVIDWNKTLEKVKQTQQEQNKPTYVFIHTNNVHDSIYSASRYGIPLQFDTPNDNIPEVNTDTFVSDPMTNIMKDVVELRIEESTEQENTQKKNYYKKLLMKLNENLSDEDSKKIYLDMLEEDKIKISLTYLGFKRFGLKHSELQYLRNIYDDGIYRFDQDLGIFFKKFYDLGLDKNTILIITADHGEEFGEHHDQGHGWNLYNTTTHVPLIMYVPNSNVGIHDQLVENVDIFPTILGLIGKKIPTDIAGIDISETLYNNVFSNSRKFLYSEMGEQSESWSIRNKQWKLYFYDQNNHYELYDLFNDAEEQKNVVGEHPDTERYLINEREKLLSNQPSFPEIGSEFEDSK